MLQHSIKAYGKVNYPRTAATRRIKTILADLSGLLLL